jgi:hypothetical protein
MIDDNNNTIPVTYRQPLLSIVRTQDVSTLPFSEDIDVTSDIDVASDNIDGTEDNIGKSDIDITGDNVDGTADNIETTDIDDTADIDVTAYSLARAETRTPAATPVRASVNRTASKSFAAAVPCLRSPVGPPNMTINV